MLLEVLTAHTPIKRKLFRANHVPYMTKALRKVIMKRSGLENEYVKKTTNENLNLKKSRGISAVNYIKKRRKNIMKCLI